MPSTIFNFDQKSVALKEIKTEQQDRISNQNKPRTIIEEDRTNIIRKKHGL